MTYRFWMVLLASSFLVSAAEEVDLSQVHRIKQEAFDSSQVMDFMFYLTDVHGPRLTNSPGFRRAGDWAVKRLQELGMENVKLEKWGPFGRGWSYNRFSAHLLEPGYAPMIGFPLAWTPGTDGPVTAETIFAPMKEEKDLEKYKGKLKGKIVLVDAVRETPLSDKALNRRYTDEELEKQIFLTGPTQQRRPRGDRDRAAKWAKARNEFLKAEGAVALLTTGYNGDGGTVFAAAGGSYNSKYPDPPPTAVLTPEHYNRIVRLLDKKVPAKVELDIKAQFHTETEESFNVVAEIPGTTKKDELVIIGAHFDSWHGGTGATDNAAGSAVMMEALRIIKAIGAKPQRTIRLVLWGGEELGLLGSKAYVKEHFADPEKMTPTATHARMAAYFNYDNGGGKIRGVYLQGNDMVRPIFESWLAPFKDMGASMVSIKNTGGTDHLSFDEVGLPGFQFVQDPLEYQSRTHHSNMDVYDRIQPDDLKQASAVVASFAWNASQRTDKLPRKPMPKPKPKEKPADGATSGGGGE